MSQTKNQHDPALVEFFRDSRRSYEDNIDSLIDQLDKSAAYTRARRQEKTVGTTKWKVVSHKPIAGSKSKPLIALAKPVNIGDVLVLSTHGSTGSEYGTLTLAEAKRHSNSRVKTVDTKTVRVVTGKAASPKASPTSSRKPAPGRKKQ